MNIALKKHFRDWIDDQVRWGRYGSETEVVEEALREKMKADDAEYFRARLRLADEDVREGRVVVADEAFFEGKRRMVRDRFMKPEK